MPTRAAPVSRLISMPLQAFEVPLGYATNIGFIRFILKIESYGNFASRKNGGAFRDRKSSVTLMNALCCSHLVPALSGSGFYPIGLINLGMKGAGARSAGNPHATCDVAGAGDGI